MPYFSVVIPLYNKQNYIAATIKSVLDQSFIDFELIIVSDVSTDGSLTVAETFSDERIKIINHKKNSGLSSSRNTGIKNATSPYIAFLDADDVWKPLFLEKIQTLIADYPQADLYGTNYEELHKNGLIVNHAFDINTGIITNFFKEELQQHIYCYSSLCVRRSAFNKFGLFNEKITMGEDVDFNVKANLSSVLAYCIEPLAIVTMHSENQITQSPLSGKVIIDHDHYEQANPEHKDLKKYLDFHRYTMAKRYRLAGDAANYKKMRKGIKLKNLNYKQALLLYAPAFILRFIKKTKSLLIKKGINPTTY